MVFFLNQIKFISLVRCTWYNLDTCRFTKIRFPIQKKTSSSFSFFFSFLGGGLSVVKDFNIAQP